MTADIFILLLNPAISLILAAALATVWVYHRSARFMHTAAIGLVCFALAFAVQDIAPELPLKMNSFLTNLFFLSTFTLMCAAVVQMAGSTIPYRTLSLIAGLTLLAVLYWLYWQDNLAARINTMNVSHSVMCIVSLLAAWRSQQHGWGRSLTLAVLTLGLINFSWRPLLVVWESSSYLGLENFHQSIYWSTTRLSSTILAVAAALALMVGLAILLLKELQTEARTDKLSSCLNRRGFEEQALGELADAARMARPKTILICDLDRFKQINDSLGHATGDAVIKAFGETLRQAMPPEAVVGRIGGEEFAVLLIGESAWQTPHLVTSCRRLFTERIQKMNIAPITASFGIYNGAQDDDLSTMLNRADAALYEAKNAGRDAVRTHRTPLKPVPTQILEV